MCLAVPGEVIDIKADDLDMPTGRVSVGGVTREVCFAYTPDVKVGDYVLVHVGFALNKIDPQEAQEIFQMLAEMEAAAQEEADADQSEPTGPQASKGTP
jgi:hydrogenase expression/formation protein HypC